MLQDDFAADDRHLVEMDRILARFEGGGLGPDVDAGEPDAEVLIESVAHLRDHLVDEGESLFVFSDEERNG